MKVLFYRNTKITKNKKEKTNRKNDNDKVLYKKKKETLNTRTKK